MKLKAAADPGKHSVAISLIYGETLIFAEWIVVEETRDCRPHVVVAAARDRLTRWYMTHLNCGTIAAAVVERPQTYGTAQQKGDQGDIHDVSMVAGALALMFADFGAEEVVLVLPSEWKGQTPKSVTKKRVDQELTAVEKLAITWPCAGKRHNVYDAIHLGLRKHTRRKV